MTTQFATEPLRVGDAPLPSYPVFDDVEEERLHRKQRLAAAFRVFGKLGLEDARPGSGQQGGDPAEPWLLDGGAQRG